eukprot:gene13648-16129_t
MKDAAAAGTIFHRLELRFMAWNYGITAYSPPEKAAAVEALSRLDSFKIVLRYQMQLQGVVSGIEVSSLVDGVTQLSQINQLLRRHRRQQEAEGDSLKLEENEVLRRLVLSIVDDPRVMLVKLADRLHNMRTLYVLPPRKQVALAQRTILEGIDVTDYELLCSEEAKEAAAFAAAYHGDQMRLTGQPYVTHCIEAACIVASLVPPTGVRSQTAVLAAILHDVVDDTDCELTDVTAKFGPEGVSSTPELKPAVWEQVYDSRALRVVLDDSNGVTGAQAVEGCYRMVQLVHSLWKPIPGEYDDYIVNRKPSGYQSLHTAVVGPDGGPLEVQIRTKTMHEVAEYGTAAHWVYKETPATAVEAVDFTQVAPKAAEPSDDPRPGQPAVRMSNGRFQDAVVVRTEEGGRRLLVSSATRFIQNTTRPGPKEEYDEMLDYLEAKGWHEKGQGDGRYTLEDFVRCRDGRFHKEDCYGHKLPTTVELLQDYAPSPSSRSGDNPDTDTPETSVSEREVVRLLRSMLEWEAEVMTGEEVGPGEVESLMDGDWHSVTVITWPDGEIHRLPRGASAGDVFLSSTEEVNVNNQVVP